MENLGHLSDGYHTFDELYEHRIALWIAVCRVEMAHLEDGYGGNVWRSMLHSDGCAWDGWFLLGMNYAPGAQITYHLPMDKWPLTEFARTLERAPAFDGHSGQDVIDRIKKLFT